MTDTDTEEYSDCLPRLSSMLKKKKKLIFVNSLCLCLSLVWKETGRCKKTSNLIVIRWAKKRPKKEVEIFIHVKTSAFTEPGDIGHSCLSGMTPPMSEHLSSPLFLPPLLSPSRPGFSSVLAGQNHREALVHHQFPD